MKKTKSSKLVSLVNSKREIALLDKELENGWRIVSMTPFDGRYVCVLEKLEKPAANENNRLMLSKGVFSLAKLKHLKEEQK